MNKQNNKRYFIHPEGWKFAGILFISSMILLFLSMAMAIVAIGFFLTVFVLWFFRDPERKTPQDSNLIISSADGKVCLIDEAYPPAEVPIKAEKMKRICVFMNVFNVHVNRSPVQGRVEHIVYKKGQFLNASLDKASDKNERSSLVVNADNGAKIIVVQIAGLVARRIVCEASKDQELKQGDRIGMIRFGSRADVYFENYKPLVKVGQKTIAGETLLAKK